MAKNERSRRRRAAKKRERTKRLARARNLRRNEPTFEPYVPDADAPFAEERFLRRALLELSSAGEISEERVQQFLTENATRPWFEIAVEQFEKMPNEQAQELAFCALETPDPDESLDLAEEALELDPDNCDARYVVACALRDELGDEAWLTSLYEAVEAGVEALGGADVVESNGGELGHLVFARPYLRAHGRLALALRDLGRLDAAAVEFEELLRADRSDAFGAREALLGVELARGELERARELLTAEPRPEERELPDLLVVWARVIERQRSGDDAGAREALDAARARCPELLPVLLEPADPERIVDPASEAAQLIEILQLDCGEHAPLREWLAAVGRAN